MVVVAVVLLLDRRRCDFGFYHLVYFCLLAC
jgi:hypothetical protein